MMNHHEDSALAGLTILQIGSEWNWYAGRLLSDLGATVIMVEDRPHKGRYIPPHVSTSPDSTSGVYHLSHNAGKLSVGLNASTESGGGVLQRLLAKSQGVIVAGDVPELRGLGLLPERLRSEHPHLVVGALTGFGLTGPRSEWRSDDLVAMASGEMLAITGRSGESRVNSPWRQAYVMGSLSLVEGMLAGLLLSAGSSRACDVVDVSLQEAIASCVLERGAAAYSDTGQDYGRVVGPIGYVTGLYPCTDGFVHITASSQPGHWAILARWIHEVLGNDVVLDPMFDGPAVARLPFIDLLDPIVRSFTERHSRSELVAEGQRRGIAVESVQTVKEATLDPHIAGRSIMQELPVEPNRCSVAVARAPFRSSHAFTAQLRRAPDFAEHTVSVLKSLLGLTDRDLVALASCGAIVLPLAPALEPA